MEPGLLPFLRISVRQETELRCYPGDHVALPLLRVGERQGVRPMERRWRRWRRRLAGATIAAAAGGNRPRRRKDRGARKAASCEQKPRRGAEPGTWGKQAGRAPGSGPASWLQEPNLAGIRWGHSEQVWGQVSEPRLGWMALIARQRIRVHLGRPRLLHHPRRTAGGGEQEGEAQLLANPAQEPGSKDRSALQGRSFSGRAPLSSLLSPLGPMPGSPLAKGEINYKLLP